MQMYFRRRSKMDELKDFFDSHDLAADVRGQQNNSDTLHKDYHLNISDIVNKPSLLKTAEALYAYLTPVIVIVGLAGNSMSFAVFTSKGLRKLSASSYLAALALADICTLLFYVCIEWLRRGLKTINPGSPIEIIDKNGYCQVLLYFSYVSRLMSSWIIVIFTIERFTGVCYPLKSFRLGAKRVISTLLVITCIASLYKPVLSGEYKEGSTRACSANPDYKQLSFVLDSLFAVSITLIPFIIITILNILIIRALILRNRATRELFADDMNIRLQFTLILLAISFFFVVFNLPYFAVWSQMFVIHTETIPRLSIDYWSAMLYITRPIFYLNYCVNFFLYSITGRCFRKALEQLVTCQLIMQPSRESYIRCRNVHGTIISSTVVYTGSQQSTYTA